MADESKHPRRLMLVAPLDYPVEFRVMPDEQGEFLDKLIMGAFVGGRMIARRAMDRPPPLVEKEIRNRGKTILRDIRPLIYTGIEEEPRGNLRAVLAIPQNPTDFDALPDEGIDFSELGVLTPLGLNIRPAEDRKFPDDLMKECCSHLDEILDNTYEAEAPEVKRILHPLTLEPVKKAVELMCVHNRPWRSCGICRS